MKALVTGGAGLIGSHIVDQLLERDYEVRILDNLEKPAHLFGKPDWIPPEAEFILGDMRNPDDLAKACGRCDSCRLRLKGFAQADIIDPIEYAQ